MLSLGAKLEANMGGAVPPGGPLTRLRSAIFATKAQDLNVQDKNWNKLGMDVMLVTESGKAARRDLAIASHQAAAASKSSREISTFHKHDPFSTIGCVHLRLKPRSLGKG